ncbi:Endoribonuclease Dicer, partial [Dissostichus eleginoides]
WLQSPHVAPLDKTSVCHLLRWHPSPCPHPPFLQPSVPYKHTKLSVSGSSSRLFQFGDISPALCDNQGPGDLALMVILDTERSRKTEGEFAGTFEELIDSQ